jgi:hypothetical protein
MLCAAEADRDALTAKATVELLGQGETPEVATRRVGIRGHRTQSIEPESGPWSFDVPKPRITRAGRRYQVNP